MSIVLSLKVVLTGNGIGYILITCHINFLGKNGSIYNLLTMLNPEGFVINAEHRFEERIRFILSVIKINENGKGASIEKVISEAAKIGMNREHAISYIEHLKQNGYTYEPINGEIKCAF
jgi:predicted transcriptional regulator